VAAKYHYTECGLDNIWLLGGFDWVDLPAGRHLKIHNIDGLHRAIGKVLVDKKGTLIGKELRFLRHELLLSQLQLAQLLQVTEQTIHRWESGKSAIPKPAETLIRLLYSPVDGDFQQALRNLTELDEDLGQLHFDRPNRWHLRGPRAA